MSLLGNIVGHAAATVGRAEDYLTPGAGSGSLTDAGRAIYNPNVVMSNPGAINPFVRGSAFTVNQSAPSANNAGSSGAGQQQSVNPAPMPSSGQYTASGSGAATSDPNLAAQYADQANTLQGQYGTLDSQLINGQQTINNSYGQSMGGINDQFALQQHVYDTNKQQNMQDYTTTSNNARTQVRAQSNALQRLLGMNGSGNSSASSEQAPYAAALQGSQMINGAQGTFAKNAANQDNNFAQTKLTTENAKKKLAQDKADREGKLQQDVATSKATLLDQIRQANINHDLALGKDFGSAAANQAGTQQQVQSLLQQIQQLGKVAPVSFDSSQIQYQTPDMAQYSLDGGAAPQAATGPQSNVDPTFLSLLADPTKKRDQFGNPILA